MAISLTVFAALQVRPITIIERLVFKKAHVNIRIPAAHRITGTLATDG